MVLLVAYSLWRPASAVTAITTGALRLSGIERHCLQLGPYRIHYFVGGSGEPLVLVHGLGGRALDFALIMPALAKQHRVFALDLLGYAGSDRPDVDYSVTLQTGILRQFLDSQGLTRFDLAGWSMGGWIALQFASQSPDRVRRLVLLDSAGMQFPPTFDLHLLSPHTMAEMERLEKLLTPHPVRAPRFIKRDFLRQLRAEDWVIQRTVAHMITPGEVMDGKLAGVTMPVLLVWGKQDVLTPLLVADAMRREMPQSVLAVLDGCGHIAPLECHERVLREMQRFLSADPPLPAAVHEVPAH
ncbi:MAG TPA: alpha/beta hydrolase [Terriglobales bacterium]|nr:alpha/beta hydrolase [Terriglobales bacterium]